MVGLGGGGEVILYFSFSFFIQYGKDKIIMRKFIVRDKSSKKKMSIKY